MRARLIKPDKFDALREEEPDWYEFKDGLYNMGGVDERGQRYSYKLAVRKTPDAWAFLAYDMTDSVRGGQQLNRARWCCRCWCSACCRWCWAGGRHRR